MPGLCADTSSSSGSGSPLAPTTQILAVNTGNRRQKRQGCVSVNRLAGSHLSRKMNLSSLAVTCTLGLASALITLALDGSDLLAVSTTASLDSSLSLTTRYLFMLSCSR